MSPDTRTHSYTASEFDSESGLYYYRARYYDPSTGRFLSEDPIGLDGGVTDFYVYVRNDPIDSLDPTGLQTQHQPGGPDHFENIKCRPGDDCPVLLDKIQKWAWQISSHYLFDWKHGTGRHTTQPGPRGDRPTSSQCGTATTIVWRYIWQNARVIVRRRNPTEPHSPSLSEVQLHPLH